MPSPASFRSPLVAFPLLVLAACADRPASEADAPRAVAQAESAEATLETAAALGVRNAREPIPGLITAGQLTEDQMKALAAAGYTNFVSLRLPGEDGAGWEEAFAGSQGLTFTRMPVSGAEGLTRENVEKLGRILDASADEPTVLYCGSSNRVGAMLALRAHWLEGAEAGQALALGRAAGLARLEPTVEQILSGGSGTP
jgi:protein tyrosine phosphatase (PTP) superfamily phosphohydrolase (DUF442 family)